MNDQVEHANRASEWEARGWSLVLKEQDRKRYAIWKSPEGQELELGLAPWESDDHTPAQAGYWDRASEWEARGWTIVVKGEKPNRFIAWKSPEGEELPIGVAPWEGSRFTLSAA